MDLKQLRYFTAILDEGGVRKAAERVAISQPALTVALQNLEAELGVNLFARVGRTLQPTAEGYHFYRHARVLLAQAETAKADMASMKSLEKAEIRIAAPITIASYVLADPIAGFMETHPGVRISFSQMGGPLVESALMQGDIDIGVLSRSPKASDVAAHQLYDKKIGAFVRPKHPLANAGHITWPQLFNHSIVTLPKSYILYENLMDHAAHYRLAADVILESDVVPLLASTIRKSDAIGLFLDSVGEQEQSLVQLPITESDGKTEASGTRVIISACHLKNSPLSIAAQALLDHLGQAL